MHIIPLDHIVVPATEDLKPTDDLIQQALTSRPEIEQTKINIESSMINLGGTRNALLPVLQAFVGVHQQRTDRTAERAVMERAAALRLPFLSAATETCWARSSAAIFPNYSAGFSLNIPLRNRRRRPTM